MILLVTKMMLGTCRAYVQQAIEKKMRGLVFAALGLGLGLVRPMQYVGVRPMRYQ
jgi:hypothetical protein